MLICFRLGVEGLEEPDSAEDSSDSEAAESPCTSGTGTGSISSHVKMAENTVQWSASSEDSASCSSSSDTAEKSQEHMKDFGKDIVEDPPTSEIAANEKHEENRTLKEGDQAYVPSTQQTSHLQRTVSVINYFLTRWEALYAGHLWGRKKKFLFLWMWAGHFLNAVFLLLGI